MNPLKNAKISKKLAVLICVASVSLIGAGYTGYHYLSRSTSGMKSMYNDRLIPIRQLNECRTDIMAMRADVFDLFVAKNDDGRKKLEIDILSRTGKFNKTLDEYEKTQLDPFEVDGLKKLHAGLEEYFNKREDVISLAMKNKNDEALKNYNETVRPVAGGIHETLQSLAEYNSKVASEIYDKTEHDFFIAMIIFAADILISLILVIWIGWAISNSITRPLHLAIIHLGEMAKGNFTIEVPEENLKATDEFGDLANAFAAMTIKVSSLVKQLNASSELMSSASTELAATSSALSEGAQSQAASLEEASASIEEVSSSAEMINRNAADQAELAKQTFSSMKELMEANETVVKFAADALAAAKGSTEQANSGQGLMQKTISGMNTIDESTRKIADTVKMISDVSDQVNLLALNASIEAARAGEHGKGFAVVAEEISKLADQTASSAKAISELVKEGLLEVNKGREYLDETSKAFNNIITFIDQTEGLVRNITDSTEKQSKSSEKVLTDTQKVMEMAESISRSMNEQMMTNSEMAKTMEQINQSTQTNAASAEEIASSAEQISVQSETLHEQVGFFKVV